MPLSAGDRLGPYEIVGPIGSGGMGEVYRARDSRLNRDVAIKVSNAQFTERFAREARAIAAVNHTNICHLYDVGPDYLVMEYVEGRDLHGPLSFQEALPVIRQLIDGIEAAHEKGIVHRDLKPANIKITSDGLVKILDFGLAKANDPTPSASSDPANSPTRTMDNTMAGTILGTAAYMAPEQAVGRAADQRSDIWSFGVVVYEILTGRKLFSGNTTIEIVGAILHKDADISAAPVRAQKLLRSCLAKDRKHRLASISDARMLLNEPEPVVSPQAVVPSASKIKLGVAIAAAALVGAAIPTFLLQRDRSPFDEFPSKLSALPPAGATLNSETTPMIAPDGRKLAFVARDESGKNMLWVRRIDMLDAQALPGTEGAHGIFWSPDSQSLAFVAENRLKRIDIRNHTVRSLCDVSRGGQGGAWSSGGAILLGSSGVSSLFTVPKSEGACVAATELNRERQERAHSHPQFLPDGRHFIYFVRSGKSENTGTVVGSLDSKETKFVLASASQAVYAPSGYLLFVRDQNLMAQKFDASKLELSGEALPVTDQVGVNAFGDGMFSVSSIGSLAYISGASEDTQLTWFDRTGKSLGTVGPAGDYVNLAISPDGRRVAFQRKGPAGDRDIWQMEIDRPVPQRVTFSPADETNPLWSADGNTLVFASNRDGIMQLFQKPANGAGAETLLAKTDGDSVPMDWSADGRYLVYRQVNKQGMNEAWVLPLFGDRTPFGYLQSNEVFQLQPRLSPNGRWIAYYSNGDVATDIFLQSFPKPGGKWQVSTTGGILHKWSRDGKELFYITNDGQLTAVSVKGESAPEIGPPTPLFFPSILGGASVVQGYRSQYDVAPDGRFLIIVPVESARSITLMLNWASSLFRQQFDGKGKGKG